MLPGGGSSFIKALNILEKEKWVDKEEDSLEFLHSKMIFRKALTTPLSTLLFNCGVENEDERKVLIDGVLESNLDLGYNLNNTEYNLVNMFECGILDAAKVPINSLISAVSSAGILLSTSVCIVCPKEITAEMLGFN